MGFIHEHAGWFLYPLIIIGVIWFWRGGAEYESAHEPFIEPLAPLNTGQTYGDVYLGRDKTKQKLDLPENPITTIRNFFNRFGVTVKNEPSAIPFSKTFIIDGIAGAAATDPQQEYLRVIASRDNTGPATLSGLIFTGSGNMVRRTLPQALNTLILGTSSKDKTDIAVPPQGRVIITSGKSPVGESFRVNMCTGYLGQYQSFVPELRTDCPDPSDELKKFGPYEEASCRSFVDKLPVCRGFSGTFSPTLSASCKKFVIEKLTYNACVADHVSDTDFHKSEWRLFLGDTKELWKDRQEVIRLYDKRGSIVDAITY